MDIDLEPTVSGSDHTNGSCAEHPHCPFCGGVMTDRDSEVVCVPCGTAAPVVAPRTTPEVTR